MTVMNINTSTRRPKARGGMEWKMGGGTKIGTPEEITGTSFKITMKGMGGNLR